LEPDESRGSSPVLGEPGGVIPLGHSTAKFKKLKNEKRESES